VVSGKGYGDEEGRNVPCIFDTRFSRNGSQVSDIESSRAARGIPAFQERTELDNSGKAQVCWIKKKKAAPERPYKTGSVTRWNNDWDSVDTITKNRGGAERGQKLKVQERIK
jgi:hypothetical protein